MFEPDIKTVGRDWARVLAASLLYLADFQRPRTTSPEAVSTAPGLISITHYAPPFAKKE